MDGSINIVQPPPPSSPPASKQTDTANHKTWLRSRKHTPPPTLQSFLFVRGIRDTGHRHAGPRRHRPHPAVAGGGRRAARHPRARKKQKDNCRRSPRCRQRGRGQRGGRHAARGRRAWMRVHWCTAHCMCGVHLVCAHTQALQARAPCPRGRQAAVASPLSVRSNSCGRACAWRGRRGRGWLRLGAAGPPSAARALRAAGATLRT